VRVWPGRARPQAARFEARGRREPFAEAARATGFAFAHALLPPRATVIRVLKLFWPRPGPLGRADARIGVAPAQRVRHQAELPAPGSRGPWTAG